MLIQGGCHCGNISFELDWAPDPAEIPARACGCSFCVKHGGVWTSNPDSALRVTLQDSALDPGYFFGTRTGRFHVCARCGVVPLVTCTLDGRTHAVVNVNTFHDVARSLLRPVAASFEGEDIEARLARRKRNWIGDVSFVALAKDAAGVDGG